MSAKEILKKIKSVSNFDDYVDFIGTEFKPLLDYITNLQEENKELLVELNKNMIERNNCLSRNEKAREMIRFIAYNSERPLTITELNKVYNILGGDKDEYKF